jgi:hypothetical protein
VGEKESDQECGQGEVRQASALPSSFLRFWRKKETYQVLMLKIKVKEIFFCSESSVVVCKTALKLFKHMLVSAYSGCFRVRKVLAAPMEMCLIFIRIKLTTEVPRN